MKSRERSINPALLSLVFLLNAILTTTAFGENKQLRWQLTEGNHLRVRITQTTKAQTQIADDVTAISMLTAMELHWRVDRVDQDGTMVLSQTITRLILESTSADGAKLRFDSASRTETLPELKEIAATIRPLLASRCSVALSPRGEIGEVRPSGETESLLGEIPAFARWKSLLSEEGLNRTLRQCLGLLPDASVDPGDSWLQRYDVESPAGPIHLTTSYEYQGAKREDQQLLDVIMASIKVDRDGQVRGAFDEPKGRNRTFVGSFYFDTKAGHLVRSQVTQTITTKDPSNVPPIQVSTSSSLSTTIERVAGP